MKMEIKRMTVESQVIADKLVDLIFTEHKRSHWISPMILSSKQLSKKLWRLGKKPAEWKEEVGAVLTECMAIKFSYQIGEHRQGSSGFVNGWSYIPRDEDNTSDYFVIQVDPAFMEIWKASESVKLILDERRTK